MGRGPNSECGARVPLPRADVELRHEWRGGVPSLGSGVASKWRGRQAEAGLTPPPLAFPGAGELWPEGLHAVRRLDGCLPQGPTETVHVAASSRLLACYRCSLSPSCSESPVPKCSPRHFPWNNERTTLCISKGLAWVCTCACVYVHVCMCTHMHVCTCIYAHACAYVRMCACVRVRALCVCALCVCGHVCVYAHARVHVPR